MPDARRQLRPATPAELDALATYSPTDIEHVKHAAQRDGSAKLNALLNATPDPKKPGA